MIEPQVDICTKIIINQNIVRITFSSSIISAAFFCSSVTAAARNSLLLSLSAWNTKRGCVCVNDILKNNLQMNGNSFSSNHSLRCHYTKSNPIHDQGNISSQKLQKQNFKPLGHYTCMQCGTSHLQTVQENILLHIILTTYRKFTVATVRFTQNVSCNIYTHPRYQQVANVTV